MDDRIVLDLYRHEVGAPRAEHYAHWTLEGRRVLSTEAFFTRTCAFADVWGPSMCPSTKRSLPPSFPTRSTTQEPVWP
jgi:hypothetical protein